MKTQTVYVEAHADAPPEVLFDLIADPATWPSWAGVDAGELVTPGPDEPFGLGAIRRLKSGRTTGTEEVIAYERPHRFSYSLLSGLPVRGYRGDVTLDAVDSGTRITWHSTFTPKFPFTGSLSQRGLQRFVEGIVGHLVAHVADARSDAA